MHTRYHEAHPLEYDFQPSDTFLIARGPGMLSAAAIALCPNVSMVPSITGDIAKVAFRFGLVVDQVCRSLEISPDEINAAGAWIYCVYGVDPSEAQEAVALFNAEKVSLISMLFSIGRFSRLGQRLGVRVLSPTFRTQQFHSDQGSTDASISWGLHFGYHIGCSFRRHLLPYHRIHPHSPLSAFPSCLWERRCASYPVLLSLFLGPAMALCSGHT